MNIELSSLTQAVVAIAKEAGKAIMPIYSHPEELAIRVKADDTPVTKADFVANQIITQGLERLTPHVPILSEEGAAVPFAERQAWSSFWLIDPLDGTKEFIHSTDEFTVNIALIQGNQTVLGVVYVPVLDVCYYACANQNAYKQMNDKAPQIITARTLPDPAIVIISRRHNSPNVQQFLERLPSHTIVNKGSSLKACLVAEGAADIYPSFGRTSEWDTAASQCIVERAGGQVIDTQLMPLRYNTKEHLLNPPFLMVGDVQHNWGQYLK